MSDSSSWPGFHKPGRWSGGWGIKLIAQALKNLRSHGPPTDFILAADGKEWPVHKVVLYIHSDVLHKMSTNDAFVEYRMGRAHLKDAQACHVGAMVEYMYDRDFQPRKPRIDSASGDTSSSNAAGNPETIEFEMGVMILADKYNVVGLKQIAGERIDARIRDSVHDSGKFAVIVDKIYDCEDLPESVAKCAVLEAADRLECLDKLVNLRPAFAVAVLKALVSKRVAEIASMESMSEDGPGCW